MLLKLHRRKPGHWKEVVIEIVGWYGVIAIVGAYLALSLGFTSPESMNYQLLNFTGAIAIMIDAWHVKNYQPAVLNMVWLVIAVVAMVRIVM